MTVRVVIADDHPLILQALSELIRSSGQYTLLEAAGSGHRALATIREHRPEIVVLDLSMPQIGGLDILRAISDHGWPVRGILLSATMSEKEIAEALAFGVWGLVLKDHATDHLMKCLNAVAAGEKWLPEELLVKSSLQEEDQSISLLSELTQREFEIAKLVAAGMSNKAIAQSLGSAEGTVSIHLHNIYGKLNIRGRTMLAALLVKSQNTK